MSLDRAAIEEEVRHWFFDIYFNHWVDVGAGRRDEGPEFVLQYWGTPMFVTNDDPAIAMWTTEGQQIVDFLVMQQEILMAAGYDHTEVPDKKIFVYNANGAAIEVIWSRQAADNTEIQRLVVHFEVARMDGVWKVVGIQSRMTDKALDRNTIDGAWSQEAA